MIDYKIHNGIATITLNRPDKFNSFNRSMADAFNAALLEASTDENIRCVVITGEGKAFCAGQDLQEAIDPNGPGLKKIIEDGYNPSILRITEMPKPVIAAALACDFVIAKQSASFIQAFSKIGLIPDSGGTYFLPRLIGYKRALAQMMLGDKVSADEAMQMGMIYQSIADDQFSNAVDALASQLSNMPTKALALTNSTANWKQVLLQITKRACRHF
jgi:2-(1,2-epoxy-1,2-dihydrophenyl)acetyl-CoA isomerase